jgi:putative oxidoreductase
MIKQLSRTLTSLEQTTTPFLYDITALLIRLILAPVMIVAGYSKLNLSNENISGVQAILADENVVSWFANPDWGLGLPFADVLAFLAGWSELLGGWLLLIGLFTRLISLPLIFTMLVAIYSVHWSHGWFAIAPSNPQTSPALVLSWLDIPGATESLENSNGVRDRINAIRAIIDEHGNDEYLTGKGPIAILNNGIEFAFTYLVLLLVLLTHGPGRVHSVDYWIKKTFVPNERSYLK